MMSETKYLFLNIEWNDKKGNNDFNDFEPVMIAGITVNSKFKKKQLFSKRIALENPDTLTNKTCKLLRITKNSLKLVESEKTVFEKFVLIYPMYDYVVVWTEDVYNLFLQGMKKAGLIMPVHNVIVLQDLLSVVLLNHKKISFKNALDCFEVVYKETNFHKPAHDVEYLMNLYKNIYSKYSNITKNEVVWVNHKSKTLHNFTCRHTVAKNVSAEKGSKILLFSGYKSCSHCLKDPYLKKIYVVTGEMKIDKKLQKEEKKKQKLTDENIGAICGEFGLEYHIASNVVFVTTNISHWRIKLHNNKVHSVLHSNYNASKYYTKPGRCRGFHKQKVSSDDFYEIIKYIYYHDENKYKVKRKKSRIEKLFDKIEKKE